ncbi:MAG: phage major capsid protein [bacterium]
MTIKQERVDKLNLLNAKRDEQAKMFAEAKTDTGELDFTKVTCVPGTVQEKLEKLRSLQNEMNDLGIAIERLAAAEKSYEEQKIREAKAAELERMTHPNTGDKGEPEKPIIKSFGQLFIESDVWKMRRQPGISQNIPDFEMKTLFQRGDTTGWSTESMRTGRVVDYPAAPIRMIDVIPMGTTNQAAVVYMEETTLTLNAAEKNEGAAYAESAFALTQRSVTVQKITTSVPVTDEQLDDVPQVQGYLDRKLRYDLMQRLDSRILVGTGVSPLLLGINNKPSVQTQAKGADPVPDAIHKGIVLVRVTGRAEPNVVVMHPNDWQDVVLLRDNAGNYIWGNPSGPITARIWGLPVVETTAQTENTAVVGDFANFSELVTRKGVEVQIGYVNADFTLGQKTIRADMRCAVIWYRASAFCLVSGL